jgi:hypothetical protein
MKTQQLVLRILCDILLIALIATYLYVGVGMECALAGGGVAIPVRGCGFPYQAAILYLPPGPSLLVPLITQQGLSVKFVIHGVVFNFLSLWLVPLLCWLWFRRQLNK